MKKQQCVCLRNAQRTRQLLLLALALVLPAAGYSQTNGSKGFQLPEATIEQIHAAYKSGQLTSRQLVQMYLDRIAEYDKKGPTINSIITINPTALDDASKLDAAFKKSGLTGPLHGIPVVLKDQFDAKGMPTTLGSLLLKNFYPDRDAFVSEKLRKAGAIILGKATLGEFGGGDTYGSLFGVTRNPYDLNRTAGGSSGGPGAAITSNFAAVAVGEEGFASIRRPSTWNGIVGMRPTAGLVSRSGMWDGWPQINGSLGPMARTVTDLAKLLDVIVGYDAEDPLTASGVGHIPPSFTKFLDKNALKGARIGILRESIGSESEPDSEDFKKVTPAFDKAVQELKAAGAVLVDPVVIPKVNELLAKRASGPDSDESISFYFGRNANPPFRTRDDIKKAPEFSKMLPPIQERVGATRGRSIESTKHYQYLIARDELMINLLKVMADNRLDAIVHKSVEHQPTLISQGTNPPYVSSKGVPHINTFLVFVPTITVPAGFTTDNLPIGISFLGRPYDDGNMIKFAYAYEQATHHRKPPSTVK